MRTPDRKGTVASFFTYWDGPAFTPSGWNEMAFEIAPSLEKSPLVTKSVYGDGQRSVLSDQGTLHGFDPHSEWHTYELEWTPDYIAYTVDGHEVMH